METIIERAKEWTTEDFDVETRKAVAEMIEKQGEELNDAFYRDLEFGTGGLRGIMGPGTNRMNSYTVSMATQGLANYLKKCFPGQSLSAAIAYDSRNNSKLFATKAAEVLSANDITVYIFDDIRPTPELSFAIRELKCNTGIVITASHNPKEYNGYKAYWDDGAQIIAPHDIAIIDEVTKITSIKEVNTVKKPELINVIGKEIDEKYLNRVLGLSLNKEINEKYKDIPIVYTPLHGTGIMLVPQALNMYGFTNIHKVESQCVPDGNFPTVVSPNPEESSSFELAVKLAKEVDAKLVLATDPDADRIGLAVKDNNGEFILLNGNQTAAILFYYLIKNRKSSQLPYYIVKTIVTSDILSDIAKSENIEVYECLTGFKYIAAIMRENEGKKQFLVGGEESYGYLCGDFVRDKDAIMSSCLIAEAAAWAQEKGLTLYQLLMKIYDEYKHYSESMHYEIRKGQDGAEEIKQIMIDYRENPPKEMEGQKVVEIRDYLTLKTTDMTTGVTKDITGIPKSNVLQFFLSNGTKISVRPSGTEPKIKYYRSEII